MLFAVEHRAVDGVPVVHVVGELDIATAPQLKDAVAAELAQQPELVVIDLTATTFLDSSGARSLAVAARDGKAQGTRVELVCPSDNRAVRRVMDFLQLSSLVPLREALADVVPGGRPA